LDVLRGDEEDSWSSASLAAAAAERAALAQETAEKAINLVRSHAKLIADNKSNLPSNVDKGTEIPAGCLTAMVETPAAQDSQGLASKATREQGAPRLVASIPDSAQVARAYMALAKVTPCRVAAKCPPALNEVAAKPELGSSASSNSGSKLGSSSENAAASE